MKQPAKPEFWDRRARKYAQKPVPDEEAYRQTLDRVRAWLEPNYHVLEIGCGTGTTALKLASSAGDIVATDLSGEMIRIAREKAQAEGIENVTFAQGTLDDALPTGSFDAVLTFNFLHLIRDVPRAIDRIGELLKPEGLFISKTPCLGEESWLLRGIIPLIQAFGQAPFVNFLRSDSLQTTIRNAGFDILETGFYPVKRRSLLVVARKTR